jgi:hypothetical protein
VTKLHNSMERKNEDHSGRYLIENEGCKIPDLPANSSAVAKFTGEIVPTPEVSISEQFANFLYH